MSAPLGDRVSLNVGGRRFETSWGSLCRCDYFAARRERWGAADADGAHFVDRDAALFEMMLYYLRSSRLPPNVSLSELEAEAEFYGCIELVNAIDEALCVSKNASFVARTTYDDVVGVPTPARHAAPLCEYGCTRAAPQHITALAAHYQWTAVAYCNGVVAAAHTSDPIPDNVPDAVLRLRAICITDSLVEELRTAYMPFLGVCCRDGSIAVHKADSSVTVDEFVSKRGERLGGALVSIYTNTTTTDTAYGTTRIAVADSAPPALAVYACERGRRPDAPSTPLCTIAGRFTHVKCFNKLVVAVGRIDGACAGANADTDSVMVAEVRADGGRYAAPLRGTTDGVSCLAVQGNLVLVGHVTGRVSVYALQRTAQQDAQLRIVHVAQLDAGEVAPVRIAFDSWFSSAARGASNREKAVIVRAGSTLRVYRINGDDGIATNFTIVCDELIGARELQNLDDSGILVVAGTRDARISGPSLATVWIDGALRLRVDTVSCTDAPFQSAYMVAPAVTSNSIEPVLVTVDGATLVTWRNTRKRAREGR